MVAHGKPCLGRDRGGSEIDDCFYGAMQTMETLHASAAPEWAMKVLMIADVAVGVPLNVQPRAFPQRFVQVQMGATLNVPLKLMVEAPPPTPVMVHEDVAVCEAIAPDEVLKVIP